MIEVKALTAGYGGTPVIENVTLSFPPGEILAVLGPNGSGKTTLLKAALGLIPSLSGQVLYEGRDIRQCGRREIARQAAYLTQSRNTPSIQALRMVLHGRFPYLSYPRSYGREDYDIARRSMDRAGCRDFEQMNVSRLSGGQRQSVYLAMALAQQTRTVFMDEPTTYLDISRQFRTMQMARALAGEGKAVVMVLHDLSQALGCADRVAVLERGRLLAWDTPERVYERGVLEQAFGVCVHRVDTPQGLQYYCTAKEETQ